MAESGGVSGILGGDGEASVEGAVSEASLDPTAAALAAAAAQGSAELAQKASAYFDRQSHLVEVQTEHLHEQRAINLQLLKLKRLAERLRVGLQVFVILVATAIGIGAIMLVRDAAKSRGVVIDEFDIAPNMAAQVPSGKTVAAGLLDVLTRIQAANRSSAEHRSLSNAWTNEIEIEVPETGISIGQLERILRVRFGHDQHVDGDLVKTKTGGLALTVRGNGILPKTFADEGGHLGKVLTQAGEYVYGQSQPGIWATYLSNERFDEAIHFSQEAYGTADPSERPYLLNAWANAITGKGAPGAMSEALPLWREALRLKPDYWVAYNNVMYALAGLGDEEGVVRFGQQLLKVAGGRPGRASENFYANYDGIVWDLPALHAESIADMESHGGIGTTTSISGAESIGIAQSEALMHDVEGATLRLKTIPIDPGNLPDVALSASDRAMLAEQTGDLKAAAREWDVFAAAYANPEVSTSNPYLICYAAPTYELTGQPAKSDAAFNAVGKQTLVDCYRFKGDVLDLRGDWAGAQEWYAKAVQLGPSIPSGYYSWGLALAKHRDLDGATAKLQAAHQRGPHWADPLKAWGDVLTTRGRTKEALAKYDEALKYAPNWKQLKDARQAAALRKT